MNFFEETIKVQQPFSNVGDPPPVLTFAEMESFYDENIDESLRDVAKDIYEYWKAQRTKNGNTAIQPGLKLKIMESATDGDDSDPYVCFRRREVRQIRKTRGRDAQSIEKLKKLRLELESARTLIQLVKAREIAKKDHLGAERRLFEQRTEFRKLKRGLPDPHKDGDEDVLINQKVKDPVCLYSSLLTSASHLRGGLQLRLLNALPCHSIDHLFCAQTVNLQSKNLCSLKTCT